MIRCCLSLVPVPAPVLVMVLIVGIATSSLATAQVNLPPTITAPSVSPAVLADDALMRDITLSATITDPEGELTLTFWTLQEITGGGAHAGRISVADFNTAIGEQVGTVLPAFPGLPASPDTVTFAVPPKASLKFTEDAILVFQVLALDESTFTFVNPNLGAELGGLRVMVSAVNDPPSVESAALVATPSILAADAASGEIALAATVSVTDPDNPTELRYIWEVASVSGGRAGGVMAAEFLVIGDNDDAIPAATLAILAGSGITLTSDYVVNLVLKVTDGETAVDAGDGVTVTIRAGAAATKPVITAVAALPASLAEDGASTTMLMPTVLSDDPANTLTYVWSITAGEQLGSLSSTSTLNTSFTLASGLTAGGEVTISLIVTDSNSVASEPFETAIIVIADDDPPIVSSATVAPASAAEDALLRDFTLAGAASDSDTSGGLTYSWAIDRVSGGGADAAAVSRAASAAEVGTITHSDPTSPAATFSLASEAILNLTSNFDIVFSLTAANTASGSREVMLRITADEDPPVARAGEDITIATEGTVQLDATGSTNDGETSYLWTVVRNSAGVPIDFTSLGSDVTSPTLTFVVRAHSRDYELELELTVTDIRGGGVGSVTDTDRVIISVTAAAPAVPVIAAVSALPQRLEEGVFDGTRLVPTVQSDESADTLTYAWSITAGEQFGSLDSTSEMMPTFTLASGLIAGGEVTISLIVTDSNNLASAPLAITITVVADDDPPIVSGVTATPDSIVEDAADRDLALTGMASDPDTSGGFTYSWAIDRVAGGGASAAIAAEVGTITHPDPTSPAATFRLAPDATLSLISTFDIIISLTATNVATSVGAPATASAETRIQVHANNDLPVANAGIDITVGHGGTLQLDGSASSNDGVTRYEWQVVRNTLGVSFDLDGINDDPTNPIKSVTVFSHPEQDYELIFELTVADERVGSIFPITDRDQVTVFVSSGPPPVARAGDDQNVSEGDVVTLDASASTDEGGTIARYDWLLVGQQPPNVVFSQVVAAIENHDNTPTLSFTAPDYHEDYRLEFELRVTDADSRPKTREDRVLVLVAADRDFGITQVSATSTELNEDGENIAITELDEDGLRIAMLSAALNLGDGVVIPTYAWTVTEGANFGSLYESGAPVASATSPRPAFVVADGLAAGGEVEITLVVSGENSLVSNTSVSDQSTIRLTVIARDHPLIVDPLPTATPMILDEFAQDRDINLDVDASDDGGAVLTYNWRVLGVTGGGSPGNEAAPSASEVGMFTANAAATSTATFRVAGADTFTLTSNLTIRFAVRVMSGEMSEESTIYITIISAPPPIITAGPSASPLNEDGPNRDATLDVTVDGGGIGTSLTYNWRVTDVRGGGLTTPTAAEVGTITGNNDATSAAMFTLNDASAASLTDDLLITFVVAVTRIAARNDMVSGMVVLTIEADDDAPQITSVSAAPPVLNEDGATSTTLSAVVVDEDAATLGYLWTLSGDRALVLLDGNRVGIESTERMPTVSLRDDLTRNGAVTLSLTVTDTVGGTDTDAAIITIIATNAPPVITRLAPATATLDEDGERTTRFTATVDDEFVSGLRFLWSVTSGRQFGRIDNPTSSVPRFLVADNLVMGGEVTISLIVSDVMSSSAPATTSITVIADDDAPVITSITPDATNLAEDGATSTGFTVVAVDEDIGALTYSWQVTAGAQFGALDSTTSAAPTFTLADNLAGGGVVTISLAVNDGMTDSQAMTTNIIVGADNNPPIITSITPTAASLDEEGTSATSFTVVVVDEVVNALTYSWQVTAGSELGSLDSDTSATPTFTLADNLVAGGSVTISLTVSDGVMSSAPMTTNLTVTANNDAPAITSITPTTASLGEVGTTATSFTAMVVDEDPASLTYNWSVTAGAAFGALTNATSASPTFTLVGNLAAGGSVTISLTVSDGVMSSAPMTTNLTITATNDAPVASAGDDLFGLGGAVVSLSGSATDSDTSNDALSFSWEAATPTSSVATGLPTSAAINAAIANRNLAVTTMTVPAHPAGYRVTLTLRVTDDGGNIATDTLTLIVNMPPVVSVSSAPLAPATAIMEGGGVVLTGTATDVAGTSVNPGIDPSGYRWEFVGAENAVPPIAAGDLSIANATSTVATISPLPNRAADYRLQVRFTATDLDGATSNAMHTVTVIAMDDQPTLTASAATIVGAGAAIMLLANVEDADTPIANIKYRWEVTPAGGVTSEIATTATASYTAPAEAADLMFTVTATDNADFTDPTPPDPDNPSVTLRVLVTAAESGEIVLTEMAKTITGPIAVVDSTANTAPAGLTPSTEAVVIINELPQPMTVANRVDTMNYRLAVTYAEPPAADDVDTPPAGVTFTSGSAATDDTPSAVNVTLRIGAGSPTFELGELAAPITLCLQPSATLLDLVTNSAAILMYRRANDEWQTVPGAAPRTLTLMPARAAEFICAKTTVLGSFVLGVATEGNVRTAQASEWLMRMGRTIADQSIAAISARGEALAQGAASNIKIGTMPPSGETQNLADMRRLAKDFSFSIANSSTDTAANTAGGFTLWGQASHNQLEGVVGTNTAIAMDGKVTSFHVGGDYRWGKRAQLGVSLAISDGYAKLGGERPATTKTSLITAIPYLNLRFSDKIHGWALVGIGSGDTTHSFGDDSVTSASDLSVLAAGASMAKALAKSTDLKVDTHFMTLNTKLGDTSAKLSRARIAVGMENRWTPVFSTVLDLGFRLDSGGAESGTGVDFGIGADAGTGRLIINAKFRALLMHSNKSYEDWGLSLSAGVKPSAAGTGASFSLSTDYGASNGRHAATSIKRHAATSIRRHAAGAQPRLVADFNYGLERAGVIVVPYANFATSIADHDLLKARLGTRVRASGASLPLELDFFIGRDARNFASNRVGVGIGVTLNR